MAKAPSFQWYPKDCDTDERVRGMDDQEFGFYMRCLNHAWINNGLPGTTEAIARVMTRTPRYVAKLWPAVGPCFELRDGRYVNPKQELQKISVREFVEKQRSAANARWDKHNQTEANTDAAGNASAMLCNKEKETGEEVLEESTPKNGKPSESWFVTEHDRWYYGAYWNRQNRAGSRKAFKKAINRLVSAKGILHLEAAEFLYQAAVEDKARFQSTQDWDWRQNMHPTTWLNGDRWEDQVTVVTAGAKSLKTRQQESADLWRQA